MDNLVEKLKEFGINSYEAKVYLALLKKAPSTGYEISQLADIPQSRAYDALKSLEVEGVVFSTSEKPQKYSPISSKELTKRFKRKMNSAIDYLEKKLPKSENNYDEPIQSIYGYDSILNKLKEIIQNTNRTLYLEIWSEDFKRVESLITAAYNRGVEIKITGFDNFDYPFGLVYKHDNSTETERKTGSRMIYVIADNEETLLGRIETRAIWTQNKDIAYLVKEFIIHEMYLLDVYDRFPEQLKYFYGAGFKKLKDKISDKKNVYNIR
ncbi:MAG: hypothetical protein NC191_07185 [Muribaculaceae bacterium]|nr:hypothetical protein [Muribaculaceae bacterium]